MPRFSEFAGFCGRDPLGRLMLGDPAGLERASIRSSEADSQRAHDAIRWRIGIAYYSFVREMFCLAVLREAGIDARWHVVPDVLWRVDL